MRTNWLLLGMLVPLAVTLAVWDSGRDPDAKAQRGLGSLYVEGGAKVVTADVDALIEQGAPRRAQPAASDAPSFFSFVRDWLPEPTRRQPVLVILVAGPERVALARSGVADERISGESPEAFVIGEDRMVAGSRDAAAEMLMRFDWVDRPLELFAVEPRKQRFAGKKGTRNSDAAAFQLVGGDVAAEVAQIRASDQRRIDSAISTVRSAVQ